MRTAYQGRRPRSLHERCVPCRVDRVFAAVLFGGLDSPSECELPVPELAFDGL